MAASQQLIEDISRFALTNRNILSLNKNIPITTTIKPKKEVKPVLSKKKENKFEDFFIPKEKDSLFWSWFIFKFGLGAYIIESSSSYFTIEKCHKIMFVKKIRDTLFKKVWKIKKREVESNLANDKCLFIKSLEAMLISDNENFIFMNDKIYYENIEFPGKKTCIIKYFVDSEKYGIFMEKEDKISDYKNKLFVVEDIQKPIKSIHKFSAKELRDTCAKLDINIMKTPTKNKTKKVLYQLLCEKII